MEQPQWALREMFREQAPDLSNNPKASHALAKRLRNALAEEDLAQVAKLSRNDPTALFMGVESDQERWTAIEELGAKNSTFAFDAGLAWATGAGANAESIACQAAFKHWVKRGSNPTRTFVAHAWRSPAEPFKRRARRRGGRGGCGKKG